MKLGLELTQPTGHSQGQSRTPPFPPIPVSAPAPPRPQAKFLQEVGTVLQTGLLGNICVPTVQAQVCTETQATHTDRAAGSPGLGGLKALVHPKKDDWPFSCSRSMTYPA